MAYLYLFILLCRIIRKIFLSCISCIRLLYISKYSVYVASFYPRFINSAFGQGRAECQRNLVPYCCAILYSSTTKLLYQVCWPWVSLSKATIVPVFLALCLSSMEIVGKMWISGLFYLAAKFGSLFHTFGQICLEWFSLLQATRVIELKDIRYAREMENNFPK